MRPERLQPDIQISPEALTFYAQTFINRWDRYPKQLPDGKYVSVQSQPLTFSLVEWHLLGGVTLGAYALDTQSRARWICLDADDATDWKGLIELSRTLERSRDQIPSYLEQSRRGGHLWFFTDPIPGQLARRFAKQLLATHHIPSVEIYPKQDELRTGSGSLVRLPLGIHRGDTPPHRYHFVRSDGTTPLAPTIREQMRILANPRQVPHGYIEQMAAHIPEPKTVLPSPRFTRDTDIVGNTPSEKIKNAISVYGFVSQFVELDRNWQGYCPFHDDSRMSFGVSQDGNFWHCFAGCKGQTVIDFWMQWQGIDFKQAVTELARQYLPPLH